MDYTIAETFTLPSHGVIYEKKINPEVKIRSMTTRDEMLRLAPTKPGNQYKLMAEIIDSCLVNPVGISSYDMCIGDYQFLMYKLRIVTYDNNYKLSFECPNCKHWIDATIDLDTALELREITEFDFEEEMTVHLPKTGKDVRLKLQTPRMYDQVEEKCEEFRKKVAKAEGSARYQDPHVLYQVMALIDKVDGEKLPEYRLEQFVSTLPLADANVILQKAEDINDLVGYGMLIEHECPDCGFTNYLPLRITSEFFRPSVD